MRQFVAGLLFLFSLGIPLQPARLSAEIPHVESGDLVLYYMDGITQAKAQSVADCMMRRPLKEFFENSTCVLQETAGSYGLRIPATDSFEGTDDSESAIVALHARVLSGQVFDGRPCIFEYWAAGKKVGTIAPCDPMGTLFFAHHNMIFYDGMANEEEARLVGDALIDAGVWSDKSHGMARLGRNDASVSLAFRTKDAAPEILSELGRALALILSETVYPKKTVTFLAAGPGLVPREGMSWTEGSATSQTHSVRSGSREIRYQEGIDKEAVERIVDRLVDPGPNLVMLLRLSLHEGIVECKYAATNRARSEENLRIAQFYGREVLSEFPEGTKLDFCFCDSGGEILWAERVTETNGECVGRHSNRIYFFDGVTQEEADRVADWMVKTRLFTEGSEAVARYLKIDKVHVVQMQVMPQLLTPDVVQDLERLAQNLCEAHFQETPFQFQLCNSDYEVVDDHAWSANVE